MNKHWHLLKINPDIAQSFQQEPIIAYRRNKNLRDLIGQTTIKNNKVQRSQPDKKGKCRPCLSRAGNLCCKQVSSTNTFTSRQTNKTYNIRHNTNCHSNHVIYLMECKRCNIQYIGKSEPPFNCRLKTHRYDANHPKQDTIQACKHYSNTDHNFNRDAQFTIIEQINDKTKSNTQKAKVLLQRENFWITELKTLTPYGFNQELNIVWDFKSAIVWIHRTNFYQHPHQTALFTLQKIMNFNQKWRNLTSDVKYYFFIKQWV